MSSAKVNKVQRSCKRNATEHLRRFVVYAKSQLNDARYYPPYEGYRYIAALALYSKCITVAEATITLLEAGFQEEAFGMTRTLVDIFITLHYIGNSDTDNRAQRFCRFYAKDSEEWTKIIADYWPLSAQPLGPKTKLIAAQYASPHKWSGKSVKEMALEPDTVETDPATGKPAVHDFAYRVIYRLTSHYVHPTIAALGNHVVQAGRDVFLVHGRSRDDKRYMSAFNIAAYVANTMIVFYRCMGDPQPERLGRWAGAIVAHIGRRHKS
ncbi:MAG TPA: DUF5677 domain-containing protein [Candidatus Angelobacter sp.]|nr:DUF5677 domain-containing protein [Candidatus Angelobacter sp.]